MGWWGDVKSVADTATLGVFNLSGQDASQYQYNPAQIDDQALIDQIQANARLDYSNTAAAYYSSMQTDPNNAALTQYDMSQGLANSAQGINANTANQVAQTGYQTASFNASAQNQASQFNQQMAYQYDQGAMNRLASVYSGVASGLGAGAAGGAATSLGSTASSGSTATAARSGLSLW